MLVFVSPLNISLHFPRAREWIKEIMSLSACNKHNSPRYWVCSLLNWDCTEVDRHVRRWLRLELLTPDLYIGFNLVKSPLKSTLQLSAPSLEGWWSFICVGCKGMRFFLLSIMLFWKEVLSLHEICAMELLGSLLPPSLLYSGQVLSWIQKIRVNDEIRGNENLAASEENLWKDGGDTEGCILFVKSMVS